MFVKDPVHAYRHSQDEWSTCAELLTQSSTPIHLFSPLICELGFSRRRVPTNTNRLEITASGTALALTGIRPLIRTYEEGPVGVSEILAQIDREIAQLQRARALLSSGSNVGSKTAAASKKSGKKKRNLSPEGRKRIAEAVRRRWAEQRKASGK